MTEEQIVEIYLQYIAKWYGIKPTEQIAEDLDIACVQVECLVDHIQWPKFQIAREVVKANVEDAKPACVILPFMKLTNND